MISFDEALRRICSVAAPLGAEIVEVAQAAGRVLAAPAVARIDSPRTDVSSMDGYAVRREDLAQRPAALKVIGRSFAGLGFEGRIERSTCARIFTGAPVPEGADHIVIQEHVECDGSLAVINEGEPGPSFIRRRASDFAAGSEILQKGRMLDARALVAAAGADLGTLEVFRRPRVRIVSTGDELTQPGTAMDRAGAVPESVSIGIAALAEAYGATCIERISFADDLGLIHSAAAGAAEGADVVVVSGGASVGEKDFAKEMFAPVGLELIFSKVSMKPGKPVWFGSVGGLLVLGVPGNPTSALVTARLFLAPLLTLIQGRKIKDALDWKSLPLASPLPDCGNREIFHRAIVRDGHAEVLFVDDSSAQRTLAQSTILVRQRACSPPLGKGTIVDVLDF